MKPEMAEVLALMGQISELSKRQRDQCTAWCLGSGERPERHIFRADKLVLDVSDRGDIEVFGYFQGIPVRFWLYHADYQHHEHTNNADLFNAVKSLVDKALEDVHETTS